MVSLLAGGRQCDIPRAIAPDLTSAERARALFGFRITWQADQWQPSQRHLYDTLGVASIVEKVSFQTAAENWNYLYRGGYARVDLHGNDQIYHFPGHSYDPHSGRAPVHDNTLPDAVVIPDSSFSWSTLLGGVAGGPIIERSWKASKELGNGDIAGAAESLVRDPQIEALYQAYRDAGLDAWDAARLTLVWSVPVLGPMVATGAELAVGYSLDAETMGHDLTAWGYARRAISLLAEFSTVGAGVDLGADAAEEHFGWSQTAAIRVKVRVRGVKLSSNTKHAQQGANKYRGGRHSTTKAPIGDNLVSHHTPAASVNGLARDVGPAIQMEILDHVRTASHGHAGKAGAVYRAKQLKLVKAGKMGKAIQMDIDDIRRKFCHRYNDAIQEMLRSLDPQMRKGMRRLPL